MKINKADSESGTSGLSLDLSTNFKSGHYKLDNSTKDDIINKLKQIDEFIKKSGDGSFKIIIHSSESQVKNGQGLKDGELAKLRASETEKVITNYLLNNKSAVYKIEVKSEIGKTEYDRDEVKEIGIENAVHLDKYTKEQFVKIEIKAEAFESPCDWKFKPFSKELTSSENYAESQTFDVSGQVGVGFITIQPGGIPDRMQVYVDDVLVGDTGYFAEGVSSNDKNAKMFNYIPRYVVELTKASQESNVTAVSDSEKAQMLTKTFDKFDDLVNFLLTDDAKASKYNAFTYGTDTGTPMQELRKMWDNNQRTFVFYEKDSTKNKIEFTLNGSSKVEVKVFSPLGKTNYTCVGQCKG